MANCRLVGDGLPSLPQIILISRGITGDDMYGFEVEGQEWHLGKKKGPVVGWSTTLTWPMAKTDKTFWDYLNLVGKICRSNGFISGSRTAE